MLTFVVRRIVASFFVLIGASFIAYILVSYAGNPLQNTFTINNVVQREQAQHQIIAALHLNITPVARFFLWLGGVLGCFRGACNLGQTINLASVSAEMPNAILTSIRLLLAATITAIIIGIFIGVVSALRQYSGLDYTVTFFAFLFFSLPTFWFGVILKDYLGIKFNDFLQTSHGAFSWSSIFIVAIVFAIIAFSLFGGELRRRLLTGAVTGGIVFALMYYMAVTHWLINPSLGPVVIAIIGIMWGLGMTVLTSGLRNRRSLMTALTTVLIGVALWYPLQFYFQTGFAFWKLVMLLVIALVVGIVVGLLYGGDDKALSARNGAFTAFGVSVLIFIDRLMRAWQSYTVAVGGRPIKTTLPNTPLLQGDFWIQTTDDITHLVLPTITLCLISLATHSRFARGSMLEVLNQDYIRTARSKGLTERTVIMRHAFRNALLPMVTVIAFDFAGLFGGAVLTETVFGWLALGTIFQNGLKNYDPNPVMAVFLVAAVLVVVANLLADLTYGALDPRIRVKA